MSANLSPDIAYNFAKRHGIVLLECGNTATIGLREGADLMPLVEARRVLGRPIAIEKLSRQQFDRKLSEAYADDNLTAVSGAEALGLSGGLGTLIEDMPEAADLLESQDDAPIIRLINGLIAEAVRQNASDIHIEPFETALSVRLRIDGVLREVLTLPMRLASPIVSRIKVMARLDIAERRVPQDGRISLGLGGRMLDLRVSTLPARAGERVVLRILDKEQASLSLEELGMSLPVLKEFRAALNEPNGIILVTGPTGSGKTTTLYAGLSVLNDATRNILTIEDPVEYAVTGVGQTQVNAKVGMTFAAGLRAILRQDPDVVMVGEIRDVETAQIAVQASLTGHLVLSTVHTNDAAGAITRLRDMGIEPFLLASTLRLVLAQRLLRRLCPQCREPELAGETAARILAAPIGAQIYSAKGCSHCHNTGYSGRIGVYEALRVGKTIRGLIGEGANEDELARAAFAGSHGLKEAAAALVLQGVTTVEEVLRVTRQEASHGGT